MSFFQCFFSSSTHNNRCSGGRRRRRRVKFFARLVFATTTPFSFNNSFPLIFFDDVSPLLLPPQPRLMRSTMVWTSWWSWWTIWITAHWFINQKRWMRRLRKWRIRNRCIIYDIWLHVWLIYAKYYIHVTTGNKMFTSNNGLNTLKHVIYAQSN